MPLMMRGRLDEGECFNKEINERNQGTIVHIAQINL